MTPSEFRTVALDSPGSKIRIFDRENTMKVKGTYSVKKWEESTYQQISPTMKLTRASVEYEFSGEIQGKASVEYLMFYSYSDPKDQHKSAASYVGQMRFDGALKGRSGTFVMEDNGKFEGGAASSAIRIAGDSGTGGLEGISGKGMYRATKDGCLFELEYTLPS